MEYHLEIKNKYFNVRKTLLEMLIDRKYNVDKSLFISFNEFSLIYETFNFDFNVVSKDNSHTMYITFFTDIKNFTKKDFYNTINKIDRNDGDKIIIILREKCNQTIIKELNLAKNKNIEIFTINILQFNITKHELIPKMELLNDQEKKELLIKYKCTVNQLPKIFKTDPITKYFGAKTGDIFKIYRNSKSVGEKIGYRYVK